MKWQLISERLGSMKPVDGGFTNATRGIISTVDGDKLFIKVGVDPATKRWAQKEVAIYQALAAHGYRFIPRLISTNEDHSGFALEYLSPENGWKWETPWTIPRVNSTLHALDKLAEIAAEIFPAEFLSTEEVNENPWLMPHLTSENATLLKKKLADAGAVELANQLDDMRSNFVFSVNRTDLVHYDVRRDNCAWNAGLNTVNLVDWNWLHLGDRRVDLNALLVNIYKSGLPVNNFRDRLDRDALIWLTGYWLSSSTQPSQATISDVNALRSHQFQSALTAYKLATSLTF